MDQILIHAEHYCLLLNMTLSFPHIKKDIIFQTVSFTLQTVTSTQVRARASVFLVVCVCFHVFV